MISLYAWQTIAQDDIIRNPNSDSFVSGNPLAWLQADQEGIVILDLPSVPFWLGGVQRIWCSSESLAGRLSEALSAPAQAIPEIRFPEVRHVA